MLPTVQCSQRSPRWNCYVNWLRLTCAQCPRAFQTYFVSTIFRLGRSSMLRMKRLYLVGIRQSSFSCGCSDCAMRPSSSSSMYAQKEGSDDARCVMLRSTRKSRIVREQSEEKRKSDWPLSVLGGIQRQQHMHRTKNVEEIDCAGADIVDALANTFPNNNAGHSSHSLRRERERRAVSRWRRCWTHNAIIASIAWLEWTLWIRAGHCTPDSSARANLRALRRPSDAFDL